MRVLIVVNYKPDNECGVSVVSQELAKHLSAKQEVMYLCLGEKYEKLQLSDNLTQLTIPSVSIKQLDVAKLTPDIVQRVFYELDNFNPDIIHSQNILFVDLVCLVWSLKNNVPFIVTFHSTPASGAGYVFPRLNKNKELTKLSLSKTYVKEVLKKVDLVVALNEYVKGSVLLASPNSKIKIVNNGIDLENYYNLKIKTPDNSKVFAFLGSYMSRKNQEFLIKAFKYLPNNYKLNLYGNKRTGNDYVKKLEKIILQNNIKNVKINDYIPKHKVFKKLESSDYFVSASLKEAQSLVIIEALASGTPVIGLDNETINELIDGRNGTSFSQEIDPKTFAKSLKDYVQKNEKNYLITAGYCRKSVSRFDFDSVTEEIISTYQSVISNHKTHNTNTENLIETIIPDQLKALFERVISIKPKKRKAGIVGLFAGLFMIVSSIIVGVWNVIFFFRKKK